jgi:glyoxalase family protein
MGFASRDDGWEVRGESRGGSYAYDAPPEHRGIPGAGTVHHVAWATTDDEHPAWRDQVRGHGAHPTDVIDRHYFRSIYFREPSGVLFELATPSPGFTVDEPLETLGEKLSIPPFLESRRADIEATVKPLDYRRGVSADSGR